MDKYTSKIINNKKTFIIFYSDWCGYSQNALKLFKKKKIKFKGYKIDKIKGNIKKLIELLTETKASTNFNCDHSTRPIIFYNGKFIGGYNELVKFIN